MEVSSSQELIGDVLSNVGQSAKETKDPPEVTSPHKPIKPAQVHVANDEQWASQGTMKAQSGRGRIKKLTREHGLNQGMVSEAQVPIIGLKRLGSQIFS